jgi:hypothetical protein
MANSSKKDDLIFQEYLIIFFDLIGQREALRKITGIPVSESEKEQFLELVRKSVGRVLMLRRAFKNYFEGITSHLPNTDLVAPEHRQDFIESQKANFHHYGLSDAIVIAVPLMNINENCTPMNGIFAALTATCGIALLSLSLKVPARAGIDVGVGVQIDDREVYGPALERAVRIEAELAEYPRLVVGQELHAYLSWVENREYQTRLGEIAAHLAKRCRKLMVQDTDGRIMLDYLGKNIREIFENKIEKEIVQNAWDYINEQHIKHIKEGNDKLSSRYFRMIRYFKSRIDSWGIE